MRAGFYAEYQGRMFRCVNPHRDRLRLLEQGGAPQPEGFDLNQWDEWSRLVDRNKMTRSIRVGTTAEWRGMEVNVRRVFELDRAALIESDGRPRPEGPDVWTVENGVWEARVESDELSDVVQDTLEIPV